MKRIKTKLLPILGITALATISAPIVASCSCGNEKVHCWYSPIAKREVVADHETNTGTFVLVLDSKDYKLSDFDIKITGQYTDILTIDSFKINQDTIEVVVKCIDQARTGKIPFGLMVYHKEWKQEIQFLTLVASVAINSISINGPASITYNTSETYTAKVYDTAGKELPEEEVEWHVDETAGGKIDRTLITGNSITLKGIGAGQVVLTATSKTVPTLVSDPLTINIRYTQPTDIELNPTSVTIRMDQTETITAKVLPEETAHQKVDWEVTTGTEVIDIETDDTTCLIKPKDVGDAVITAKTLSEGSEGFEIKTRTCAVKITAPLATSVAISPSGTTIWNKDVDGNYNSQEFKATTQPKQATDDVTWSITSGSAKMTQDGVLTIDDTTTTSPITVKAVVQDEGKVYNTATLNVNFALEAFTIGGDSTVRVRDGVEHKFYFNKSKGCTTTPDNATYDTSSLTWYVDDTTGTYATIDESTGVLTPIKEGSVKVWATMETHGDDKVLITSDPIDVTIAAPYSEEVVVDTNPSGIETIWNTDDSTGSSYNTIDFDATVKPEGASQTVEWTKDASDVTINEDTGVVTLDANTRSTSVTATATAQDGGHKTGSKKVNIKYVLKNFSVKGDKELRTGVDSTAYAIDTDSISPSGAVYSADNVTWKSSNESVASFDDLDNPSVLTAHAAGTTKITAIVYTHYNSSVTEGDAWTVTSVDYPVTVLPPYADAVTIQDSADRTIWNDGSTTFKATVTSASGKTPSQAVNWKVYSDSACSKEADNVQITWDANYMATLSIPDSSKITSENNIVYVQASAVDVASGSILSSAVKVTIKIPLDEFSLKSDGVEARVGQSSQPTISVDTSSYQPTGCSVDETAPVFSTSDSSIATIDSSTGVISAVAAGTVKVTAVLKTHDGTKTVTSEEFELTVMQPYVTSLTIKGESTLWSDETSETKLKMNASYQPSEAIPNVAWSSSDTSVAKINASTGVLTLVGNGTTTITAEAKDGSGLSATHELTVKVPADSVTINNTSPTTLKVADATTGSGTYTCTVDPEVAKDNGTIVWSVSDDSLATIDSSTGVMTARAKGEVYVYAAWTATGRTDVKSTGYKVTITEPDITGLTISGLSTIPLSNGSSQYTVTASPTGASALSDWVVYDDEECSTVSTKATITAVEGDASKANLKVTAGGNVWIKATSQALSSVSSPAFKVTITTSWTDIFEIGTTTETNDTVMGFKSGLEESTLSTYCTASGDLSFPNITTEYPNITKINAEAFKDVFETSKFPELAGIVKKISIPANIEEIGDNAFDSFAGVTNLEIAGSTSIGDQAFINCSSLATINALNVTSVGEKAFYDDDAISTINFGTNASLVIGDYAFADIFTDGTTVTLTANPKTIGSNAFAETTNLIWAGINNVSAITSIGDMAFTGCKLLTTGSILTVNDKLAKATIGDAAFYATGIESIVLPAQTSDEMYKNWGTAIFGDCESLTSIDISAWATDVPSNLSSASRLFVYAGGPSPATGTCKWYYKSGIDATIIAALTTWMTSQIGEENIGNWTATAK